MFDHLKRQYILSQIVIHFENATYNLHWRTLLLQTTHLILIV